MSASTLTAPSSSSPTTRLHQLGQSIWLDNITRGILDDGTLADWIGSLSVTGLTSNPSIYNNAISKNDFYNAAIAEKVGRGLAGEGLFFELAIEDLQRRRLAFAVTGI
ncbi:MAG: transaldolase family protein, partial [Pirellulales bacterium]